MPRAPVVSILNMKGGVGKTTVSAHVMRVLYHRHGVSTLLVDLDPQFNLTQCVVTRKVYDTYLQSNRTIISAFEPPPSTDFFDVRTTSAPPPPATTLAVNLRRILSGEKVSARLDLICGAFDLVKYSMIDDRDKLKSALGYFRRFISAARDEYNLVVIDCNPSSSFITQCAITTCTHIISPVRPDKYSALGVELVDKLVDRLDPQPRPDHLVLINGVNRGSAVTDPTEAELRTSKYGSRVLANRLYRSGLLAARSDYTGFATDRPVPWRELLRDEIGKLTDEIVKRLGLTP